MPAPKYNEYWKKRQKHGRNKIFQDKEQVIELAQEYLDYCKNNPVIVKEMIKGGERAGEIIDVERPQIPTQKGFALYIGMTVQSIHNYRNKPEYKDFFDAFNFACEAFEHELEVNSITGQANAMLAARMLGLKDKQDVTSNDKEIQIGKIEIIETNPEHPEDTV